MTLEANLSVGTVAKRAGVAVSALHFYEKKDLFAVGETKEINAATSEMY